MGRRDQGSKLKELELQAGSHFVKTRAGLDTGTRTWLIDSAFAAKKQPRIGSRDIVYPGMFLEQLELLEMENGVTALAGSYLGLIDTRSLKPDVWDKSTTAEYSSSMPSGSIQPVTLMRPVPRVTHTYLAKKEPLQEDVGKEMPPKGYPRRFATSDQFWQVISSDEKTLFEGWVLSDRQSRQAGRSVTLGSIYEVVDVHSYTRITVPADTYTFP